MITISMAQSLPREEMEVWFRRSMTADLDCQKACSAKLEFLQPQWGGSDQAAMDFGMQCYRTRNYYALLPYFARYPKTAYLSAKRPFQG